VIPWQTVALIGGGAVGIIAIAASAFVKNDLRVERRLYWVDGSALQHFSLSRCGTTATADGSSSPSAASSSQPSAPTFRRRI
jgi:hypothetical protein